MKTHRSATPRRQWAVQRARATRRRSAAYDEDLQHVIDTCPGFNLGKAYKKVTRIFEEEFRSSELTLPQFAVLVNTGISESTTGTQIAQRLGSDLSTISRTMDIVVRRGLVELEQARDKRVRVYRLTSAGRQVLEDALTKWRVAKHKTLAHVDCESWDMTLRTLRELAALPDS